MTATAPGPPPGGRRARPRAARVAVELLRGALGPAVPDAACAGMSPTFDGDLLPGETGDDRDARLQRAARTCTSCPARAACAQAAAAISPPPLGCWGGDVRLPPPAGRPRTSTTQTSSTGRTAP